MHLALARTLIGCGLLGGQPGSLPSFRTYDIALPGPALELVVEPFDADANPDAALVARTGPTEVALVILRGNGNGRMTPVDLQLFEQIPGNTNAPTIATGDLNGDALLDFAVSAIIGGKVFLGDGDLFYTGQGGLPTAGGKRLGFELTDYDLDGDLDSALLVDDIGEIFVDIGTNDGSGTFEGLTFLFGPGFVAPEMYLLCIDTDNDGAESIFATGGGGLSTLGEWGEPMVEQLLLAESGTLRELVGGDLNGDGFADLAVTSVALDGVHVLLNDGAGGFPSSSFFPSGRRPESVAIGDLTGDGLTDLAVANRRDNDVAVLAGDGNGGFVLAGLLPAPAGPVRIGLADLDLDGDTDLLVAGALNAALRVGLNQWIP